MIIIIKIIIFIIFINIFILLIFIKITNKVKDSKKNFTISLKHYITVIKWFKSLVILKLMFITLKAYFYLIFFNIKMYSLLNLIIHKKLKFTLWGGQFQRQVRQTTSDQWRHHNKVYEVCKHCESLYRFE